jgi:hypothetical protein
MRLLYLVVCEEACHHLLSATRLAKGPVNRLVGQSTRLTYFWSIAMATEKWTLTLGS